MRLFSPEQLSQLQATADHAIWMSHQETFHWSARRALSTQPPEEDYVASLILRGLPMLSDVWEPLFRQWHMSLKLTGVFCHQSPKAEFTCQDGVKRPELADLLIVRRHEDQHQIRQVAVLIQGKMSRTGEIKPIDNKPQLHLYTKWPPFKVIGQMAPTTSFNIGRNGQQCVYAGIADCAPFNSGPPHQAWVGWCPWAMMPPKDSGWVEEPLSLFLLKLLSFDAGREFFNIKETGCHWSELIDYLLRVTFSMPLRTRDIRGYPDFPRGGTISLNRSGFMSALGGPPSAYLPADRARELGGGGQDRPPIEQQEEFSEGGMCRVIAIESWGGYE